MLKLKQYICKHNFDFIAKHKYTSQNLWKCNKCGVYLIQHWGIGVYGLCKAPDIGDWEYEDE